MSDKATTALGILKTTVDVQKQLHAIVRADPSKQREFDAIMREAPGCSGTGAGSSSSSSPAPSSVPSSASSSAPSSGSSSSSVGGIPVKMGITKMQALLRSLMRLMAMFTLDGK